MQRLSWVVCLFALLVVTTVGCGGSDKPKLATVGGTVTYNGEPLADANVVFIPDSGPAAMGKTGPDGKFTLATGGDPGAPIGPGKLAVTAIEQLIEIENEEDMTTEEIENATRWLIPQKYGHVTTSGLTETVNADGNNDFQINLTD